MSEPKFEFPVAIKELAEVELECPCPNEQRHNDRPCDKACPCEGTTRPVLLPSLWVTCPHGEEVQQWACWPCVKGCDFCDGCGWVPLQNVRVACEVVIEYVWQQPAKQWHTFWAILEETQQETKCSFQEAVIRAAQAWLKEQCDKCGEEVGPFVEHNCPKEVANA